MRARALLALAVCLSASLQAQEIVGQTAQASPSSPPQAAPAVTAPGSTAAPAAEAAPATAGSATAPANGTPSTAPAPTIAAPPPAAQAPAAKTSGAPVAAPARSAAAARTSLLPLAQPLWSDLNARQRETLAPLESQWNALPTARKRAWISLADRVPAMKPDERARAQARIREWASLTPEQRVQARNNFRLAKSLPQDERVAHWQQYEQMTPEQQSVLRSSGWTSNTAARHAGSPTGLAKEAARPLAATVAPVSSPPSGAKGAPGRKP